MPVNVRLRSRLRLCKPWTEEEKQREEAFLEECRAAQLRSCLKERKILQEVTLRPKTPLDKNDHPCANVTTEDNGQRVKDNETDFPPSSDPDKILRGRNTKLGKTA